MPRDCIDRVTSQSGDRVLFERLATPKPPPTVMLKTYLQIQQQQQQQQPQQPKLEDDTQRLWKQRATWESRAVVRDDTKHATEKRATKQLVLPTSEAKDDTLLTVNEELIDTNTEDIERIENWFEQDLYSRRPCEREDGVQQRIQPSHLRNGQCGAHGTEENIDSLTIVSSLRIWKNLSLQLR